MEQYHTRPLNSTETAALIGISEGTLRIWRCQGKGPRYLKMGAAKQAAVFYMHSDVLAWLESHKQNSTSDYQAPHIARVRVAPTPRPPHRPLSLEEREALTIQPWLLQSPTAK